jgi:hypothetical protein
MPAPLAAKRNLFPDVTQEHHHQRKQKHKNTQAIHSIHEFNIHIFLSRVWLEKCPDI